MTFVNPELRPVAQRAALLPARRRVRRTITVLVVIAVALYASIFVRAWLLLP